jgi:hypothetical protein
MNNTFRKFAQKYVKETPKVALEFATFGATAITAFWILEEDIPKIKKDFSALKTHEKALSIVGISAAMALISPLRFLTFPYLGYVIYDKSINSPEKLN